MEIYEIRIIKDGRRPVIYACQHESDYAAIRRAQNLVEAEDRLEVWRGLDCIYAAPLESRIAS
jgi:hypothetical protein